MIRFVLLLIFFVSTFSSPAYAGTKTIEITSDPKKARVELYRIDADLNVKTMGRCKTPCRLKLRIQEQGDYRYLLEFRKKGYVSDRDIQIGINNAEDQELHIEEHMKTAKAARAEQEARDAQQEIIDAAKRETLRENYRKRKAVEIETCMNKVRMNTSINSEAAPCRRPVPMLPTKFRWGKFSGYCDLEFDVRIAGSIDNISMVCTNSALEKPTLKTVNEWLYIPARAHGKNIPAKNVTSRVKFIVMDDNGNQRPFPPTL